MYQHLADAVLVLHASFVIFVVAGLLLIIAGGCLHWEWVRNGWFRLSHLACIGIVIAQSWLGVLCPLTSLEMWLRQQAGGGVYAGSFIQHWLQRLLFYDAPTWAFITVYTLFGLLVVASWVWLPPQFKRGAVHPAHRDH